jgi:hypothetical protein
MELHHTIGGMTKWDEMYMFGTSFGNLKHLPKTWLNLDQK